MPPQQTALTGPARPFFTRYPAQPWSAGATDAEWVRPLVLLGACALLSRMVLFGNSAAHIDEQFYLLVGDRMLQGTLPYVDIWDRKPIGLFLIYAFARSLGGDGVLAYQLLAWASVTATALTIYRLARRIAPAAGALWAGVAYILYLLIFNCLGGQSPVFYNLPVALAAALLVPAAGTARHPALLLRGSGVMLLVGLALQVKYTVVFEGMAFGLILLRRAWLDGQPMHRLAGMGTVWIAAALAPTLLAWAWFAWHGHNAAFVEANFLSIFARATPLSTSLARLLREMLALLPFWLAIFHASRHAVREGTDPKAEPLLLAWAVAAVIGFLLFGTWYDHYVAPLLPPLAVASAPAFGRAGRARGYTRLMLLVGIVAGGVITGIHFQRWGSADNIEQASALIRSRLAGGCLYVFEGEPVLYRTTGSCLPTRFVFPSHLSSTVEAKALGVPQEVELRRIMATRPSVIAIATKPIHDPPNLVTRAILMDDLNRGYRHYADTRIGAYTFQLWQRADLAGKTPTRLAPIGE